MVRLHGARLPLPLGCDALALSFASAFCVPLAELTVALVLPEEMIT